MTGRHERGDYRLRRAGLFWAVERRWFGRWDRVGALMCWPNAHAVFHELDDWQFLSRPEVREAMRGDLPCQPHGAEYETR